MFAAVQFVRDHMPTEVDAAARHVALLIASNVSARTGVASVGVRRLADEAGRHPTTVVKAIERLELAGVLAVTRAGNGGRSSYRFPVLDRAEVVPNRATHTHGAVVHNRAIRAPKARVGGARVGSVNRLENARDAARSDGSIFLPGTGWVSHQKAASA